MKKVFAAIMSMAVMATFTPIASAQSACPPEVAKAKEMLSGKSVSAPRSLAGSRGQDPQAARGQDVQTPRSLAGARGQDPQAARGENAQAARGENAQAARGENAQAARTEKNPQAARGENAQAARGENAQAARGENAQAARGENAQAARGGQDIQTARAGSGAKPAGDVSKASGLIKEAEAACKAGDVKTAKEKADAAISILK